MKESEVKEFLWDLYYLVEGKLPIDQAFSILVEQSPKHADMYENVALHLSEGLGLASSLEKAGFTDKYIISVLKVAEHGNFLEEALLDLCKLLDEKETLKSKMLNSLIYPVILLFFAFITIIFTFTYVVPSVLNIYNVLGIQKSILIDLLLKVNIGYLFIAILVGFIGHCYWAYRRGKLYELFFVGKLLLTVDRFLFYKVLSNLLKGGVPLYQSIEIMKEFPRQSGGLALDNILQSLFKGQALYTAMDNEGFDSQMVNNFVKVAEESGDLDKGIARAESFYKRKLDKELVFFGKIFEPIVISAVGITVLVVVVTLLLPIYQLFQNM